jgi:virginiamycin B lyase
MQIRRLMIITAASVSACLLQSSPVCAQGAPEDPPTLVGRVTSDAEGAMEGVVVSAKKNGQTITTSVVTDERGRYAFPRGRLSAGEHTIAIRAVGYELDAPTMISVVAGKAVSADLKLRKTSDLSAQLTNAEWLDSMPGSYDEKRSTFNCAICHDYNRIARSTHKAEEWPAVFARMSRYASGTVPEKPQVMPGGDMGEAGASAVGPGASQRADYLSKVNLSQSDKWSYPFKTFDRPKGKATRVIYTEYDLPRRHIQPHDVIIGHDQMVWYADFGDLFLGRLDPVTGAVNEYPIPPTEPGLPVGILDFQADDGGNYWAAMLPQNSVIKFDPRTSKFTTYLPPPELRGPGDNIPMVSPYASEVDGKVWALNGKGNVLRLDVATGKFENLGHPKDAQGHVIPIVYGIPADSSNNLFLLGYGDSTIGRLDAKTLELNIIATPLPPTLPRRGNVDSQGRLWFAEFGANRIGMFDPKTKKIKEWTMPTPFALPYDVIAAKSGEVWTGGMHSDRVSRLNPATGAIVEYLLPRPTNIRRVFFDNTKNALWIGSNHGGSIIKVEPLD